VGGPGDFFEEHLCGALSSMLAAGEDDEEEEMG